MPYSLSWGFPNACATPTSPWSCTSSARATDGPSSVAAMTDDMAPSQGRGVHDGRITHTRYGSGTTQATKARRTVQVSELLLERLGAADDLHQLLGDRGLPCAVVRERKALD